MVEPLSGKRSTIGWSRPFGHPRCKSIARWIRSKVWGFTLEMHNFPAVNFLGMHYVYFFLVSLVASAVMWGSQTSTPGGRRLEYVDALFLAISAQTLTGLNTVNLSTLNTFQQFVLFVLLLLGSVVWVSIAVIQIRKTIFLRKIRNVLTEEQSDSRAHMDTPFDSSQQTTIGSWNGLVDLTRESSRDNGIEVIHQGHNITQTIVKNVPVQASPKNDMKPKCPTARQYAEIGGVEYRALCLLSYIVPAYFTLFQLCGCIGIGWWISVHKPEVPLENGLDPWWMGAFNAVSAFNNSGMSLLDQNMVPFQESFYVLTTMSLLILAGNTCFPVFLRLIVWSLYKLCPENSTFFSQEKKTLKFLLDHPRRCYPYLFKPRDTWWLAAVVVSLNGIDWAAFEILNESIGNSAIGKIPLGARIMDGLFQAFAVRSGGFQIIPITETRIGLQVLYVAMMYISVYPLVLTIRNTNVYEEQCVGIYEKRPLSNSTTSTDSTYDTAVLPDDHLSPLSKRFFLKEQLRTQLAHDLWWLALAIWLITIVETPKLTSDPINFSVFNIVFEAVSAYGTVGISIGYPDVTYSFCGRWHWVSKLLLCAVMLKGRHRGLPVEIDMAIMLPSEEGVRSVVTQGREMEMEEGKTGE